MRPYFFFRFVRKTVTTALELRRVDRVINGLQPSPHQRREDIGIVIRAMLASPRLFADRLREPEIIRARLDATEPFLKVARLQAVEPFEWSGAIELNFPDHVLPGEMVIRWSAGTLAGTHRYPWMPITAAGTVYQIKAPQPGRIRGPARSANAATPDGMLDVVRISGVFEEGFPSQDKVTEFTAQRLLFREDTAEAAFVRYLFGGARLAGYLDSSERATFSNGKMQYSLDRDSFDTVLFGLRARITQAPATNNSIPVIGVTIAGKPLDDAQEHILWLVLSFVVGGRVQALASEVFDREGKRIAVSYRGGVEYGPVKSPPFDLRVAFMEFSRDTWTVLVAGFERIIADGYPLAIALHHLHEANTSYYQIEIKNLLLCIHTLFEAWTDKTKSRAIVRPPSVFKAASKALQSQIDTAFAFNHEACMAATEAIRHANDRGGSVLQELFFAALGIDLSEEDLRALHRRNRLFHRGYLRHDPSNEAELQMFLDDTGSLRTLAHHAILKLSNYVGPFLDYRTYENLQCEAV